MEKQSKILLTDKEIFEKMQKTLNSLGSAEQLSSYIKLKEAD